MINSDPNPWNFSNKDIKFVSPDEKYRIEYVDLSEIAMGGPLGGQCFLIYPSKTRLRLSEWAGGPIAWETHSRKVAFPIWTRSREQKIAVADLEANTLSIYSHIFRVLDLKTFNNNIIEGHDSPIHMTTLIKFDLSKERAEKVRQLK